MDGEGLDVDAAGAATTEGKAAGSVEERYALLDAGRIALVQDKNSGEVIGVQLLFGGVVGNRLGAMHTLDMLENAMRMTGWRIDQVARLPADASQSVQ